MFICGSSIQGKCVIIACKAIFSLHKAFCSHKLKKLCIPPFLHFVCVNTACGEKKKCSFDVIYKLSTFP